MSILDCMLAAEKPMDGKPFTVCDVSTWYYLQLGMLEGSDDSASKVADNAARIYDLFGNGDDKSERGATFLEILGMASNGGIRIIPKTKDKFIRAEEFESKEDK